MEVLLEAAAQVFLRDGYEAATTEAIAERSGFSIGSLYQYFANKEAMLVALAELHIDLGSERIARRLAEARGRSIEAAVEVVVAEMFDHHAEAPDLHRIIFYDAPLPETLDHRVQQNHQRFAEVVHAFLHTRPEGAQITYPVVYLAVHTVEAIVHEHTLRPDPRAGREAIEPLLVRTVTQMLSPDPPGKAHGNRPVLPSERG